MLMVKAGDSVDQTIEHVLPYLEKGDIVIDGGRELLLQSIDVADEQKVKS